MMESEKITFYRTNEDKTKVIEQLPKTVTSQVYDSVNEQFLHETITEITDHNKNDTDKKHIEVVSSVPNDFAETGILMMVDGSSPDVPSMVTVDVLNENVLSVAEQLEEAEQQLEQKVNRSENKPFSIMKYLSLVDSNGSWSDAIDQAIIDAELTGQEIWFPKGIYLIHRPIYFMKNTKFIGSGSGESFTKIQVIDNSNCDAIVINLTTFSGCIRNMRIAGDYRYYSTQPSVLKSTLGSGVVINRDSTSNNTIMVQPDISNCVIEEFAEYSLKVDGKCWVISFQNLDLRRSYKGGLYDNGTDNHFVNINIYENGLLGAYLYNPSANQYANMKIYLNGKYATYDANSATGMIIERSSRCVFTNIEVQQSYHNGVLIKGNCRNTEMVNFTFDESGYIQVKDTANTPTNFKVTDLIIENSVNVRGSHMVFSAREGGNIDHAIHVKSDCRNVDLIYDLWNDGTARYINEKKIETAAEINVRSYTEEFDRLVENGNTKLTNLNTDSTLATAFWDKPSLASPSISNGVLTMTPTAQYQSLFARLPFTEGDVVFVKATLEMPTNYQLYLIGYGYDSSNTYRSLYRKQIVGKGEFTDYYAIGKAPVTTSQYTLQFGRDEHTTGFQQQKIKEIAIINVTKDFPDFNWTGTDAEGQLIMRYIAKYGYPESTILIGDKAKINFLMNGGL